MKRVLPIIVLSIMLLPGCTGEKDRKIAELTKKIEQLTKEKEQDTFNKKIECKKYEIDLVKNPAVNPIMSELVQSVFYSSQRNSCLLAKRTLYFKANSEILSIEDIHMNEVIWSKEYKPIQKAWDATASLDEQIKQLE